MDPFPLKRAPRPDSLKGRLGSNPQLRWSLGMATSDLPLHGISKWSIHFCVDRLTALLKVVHDDSSSGVGGNPSLRVGLQGYCERSWR